MWSDLLLALLAFATSFMTANLGLGGGLVLIAGMPGLVPTAAIVPLHGMVQLASNASRAWFDRGAMQWQLSSDFILGSFFGCLVAALFIGVVSLHNLPLFIALFILYTTWGPPLALKRFQRGAMIVLGFVQTGLGLVVGATGPLGTALLVNKGLNRDQVVVTNALFMSVSHGCKIVVFGVLGFQFLSYAGTLAGMIAGVVLGSYLGSHTRKLLPEALFKRLLRGLLTLLALRMLWVWYSG